MHEVIGLDTNRVYITGDEAYCRRTLLDKYLNERITTKGYKGYGSITNKAYDEPMLIRRITE